MSRLDGYRMKLMLVGVIAAIVLGCLEPADGSVIAVGPGPSSDFDTIQAGIDATSDGDMVLMAPGEYVIAEPITFRGKAITVTSEAGPDETIIRMGTPADTNRGSVVVFESNETDASVLDGFTITGGSGSWVQHALYPHVYGGGVLFNSSSATVRNCAIVQNRAGRGGGVVCLYPCSPTLIDCIIAENSSIRSGGGLSGHFGASLTLTNCIVRGNSAGSDGGGVMCAFNSSMNITNCTILENSGAGHGAGLNCWESSSVMLGNCTIAKNSSDSVGAGVFCGGNSSIQMTNCSITNNSASSQCGAIFCFSSSLVNITNSIIWGNAAPNGDQITLTPGASTLTVTYSNVAGGQTGVTVDGGSTLNWGAGNIDADPCFADPNNEDYHLKSEAGRWDPNSQTWVRDEITSPCIDAGDPMSPIRWEPFPNGGFVNMGAYAGTSEASKTYFGKPICETIIAGDINGDGQVNRADMEIMALHWTDEEPLPLP